LASPLSFDFDKAWNLPNLAKRERINHHRRRHYQALVAPVLVRVGGKSQMTLVILS
jgi:hypothetical protein